MPAALALQAHDELALNTYPAAHNQVVPLTHETMECAAELSIPPRMKTGGGIYQCMDEWKPNRSNH